MSNLLSLLTAGTCVRFCFGELISELRNPATRGLTPQAESYPSRLFSYIPMPQRDLRRRPPAAGALSSKFRNQHPEPNPGVRLGVLISFAETLALSVNNRPAG